MRMHWLAAACLASPLLTWAATPAQEDLDWSGSDIVLDVLPSHIPRPPKGKLTVYADYSSEKDGVIWVYFINRTGQRGSIVPDGDLMLRQEAKLEDGSWERSEAESISHPDCPNYGGGWEIPVPDESFLARRKRLHSTAEDAVLMPVRYHIYSDGKAYKVLSNAGQARVSPAEIETAKYDRLAMWKGPKSRVLEVATGVRVVPDPELPFDPQWGAIQCLRRFPDDPEITRALRKIIGAQVLMPDTREFHAARMIDTALEIYRGFVPKKVFVPFCLQYADQEDHPYRMNFVRALVDDTGKLNKEARVYLDRKIRDPHHADFALFLPAWVYLAQKEEALAWLDAVVADSTVPQANRDVAKRQADDLIANAKLMVKPEVRTKKD